MSDRMTDFEAATSRASWQTALPVEDARADLHHRPFRIFHGLESHPLFQVEALVEVARSAAHRPGDVYFDAGRVDIDDKWGYIPIPQRPVEDIIRSIEDAQAWIIIKHVEEAPAYGAVLDEFAAFVRDIAGPEGQGLLDSPEMLVLVSSPNRVTPFHFDAEVNFLVQIQGTKDVWICDPADREAVTVEEIERYYAGHHNAGTYKPGIETRASHFVLQPGEGVHIPTHAAHWVHNGNAVSVSLSLNFELPRSIHRDIYRVNRLLRKLGMRPRPSGESALADRLKASTLDVASRFSHWMRPSSKVAPRS